MELSPDKRETVLITLIRSSSLLIFGLNLFLYDYLHQRITIFLLCLAVFILALSRFLAYRKIYYSVLLYSKVLFVFLPISLSLNFVDLSFIHFTIISILSISFFITLYLKGFDRSELKKRFYFVIVSALFLVLILLFVFFYPIKSEYQVSVDLHPIIFKSLYLLLLLFLLYHLFEALGRYRHLYTFGPSGIIGSDTIFILYVILTLSLSVYDIINLRSVSNDYLRSYTGFDKEDILRLSKRLYIKGMHRDNVRLLYKSIENGLDKGEPDVLTIIDVASKEYPYECVFYNERIKFYKKFKKYNELEKAKKEVPAPLVKRGCIIKDDG